MAEPEISNRPAGLAIALYPGTGLDWQFQRKVGGVVQPLAGWGATFVAVYDDGTEVFDTLTSAGSGGGITIDAGTDTGTVAVPAVTPPAGQRRAAQFTLTLYPPGGPARAYVTGRLTWAAGPASPGAP